ncbi:HD domain-containing protein [Patescibacteria group bacterium]|nr:HD domain-containing protein [Patescibacteria group bacterium]MBU1885537.1 HD domain-containing protein [Patescibacteria group bacterium]
MKHKNILKFFHEIEALKKLLRHSWLSDGRQESVAEHTWRITMMALILYDQMWLKYI